jgi:hypothetical protein
MKQIIISTIFICVCCVVALAQARDIDCPSISVTGPSYGVPLGTPIKFSGDIGKEVEKYNVQYFWSISSGKLISGQGSKTIIVLEEQGKNVTVLLEVKGLPEKCYFTASETAIPHDPPSPILIDEFDSFGRSGTRGRLDKLFDELQSDKDAEGVVLFSNDNGLLSRIKILRNHVRFRHFSAERITIAISDDAGQLTRFYRLSPGAELNYGLMFKLEDFEKLQKIFAPKPVKPKTKK